MISWVTVLEFWSFQWIRVSVYKKKKELIRYKTAVSNSFLCYTDARNRVSIIVCFLIQSNRKKNHKIHSITCTISSFFFQNNHIFYNYDLLKKKNSSISRSNWLGAQEVSSDWPKSIINTPSCLKTTVNFKKPKNTLWPGWNRKKLYSCKHNFSIERMCLYKIVMFTGIIAFEISLKICTRVKFIINRGCCCCGFKTSCVYTWRKWQKPRFCLYIFAAAGETILARGIMIETRAFRQFH